MFHTCKKIFNENAYHQTIEIDLTFYFLFWSEVLAQKILKLFYSISFYCGTKKFAKSKSYER